MLASLAFTINGTADLNIALSAENDTATSKITRDVKK